MAKQDLCIDIRGPMGHAEQITVFADPDEPAQVRDALRTHLAGKSWDPRLWGKFTATWQRGFGLGEVRAD